MRPKLEKLLADTSIGTIIVENRDRLTRFGSHYIETLWDTPGSIAKEQLVRCLPGILA
jgi:predicted site-specific integrase-resolvase